MKPFARPKVSGSVTIRRFHPPQLETTAKIKKGELTESIESVALRVGLTLSSDAEPVFLVDAQELAIMGKLVDQETYFLSGGNVVQTQEGQDSDTGDSHQQQRLEGAERRSSAQQILGTGARHMLLPDAAVAWAFDARVLQHQPDSHHRSPETPYRLQRAIEALQTSPRAREMLPQELLGSDLKFSATTRHDSQQDSAVQANKAHWIPPRLATRDEIFSFQDPSVYRAFVDEGKALQNLKTDVYCNEQTSSVAVKLSAAAVIDAGGIVLAGARHQRARNAGTQPPSPETNEPAPLLAFCLVRPPGHHCTASRPSGFCLVNNVAIAAQQLLQTASKAQQQLPRIAILDLDVHFGEGTAAFVDNWRRPETATSTNASDFPLLYLSLHRYDKKAFYPFDANGATSAVGTKCRGCICNVAVDTNAHVPAQCHEVISDELVEQTLTGVFLPRLTTFRPDVVFISLGFDAGYGDPLGKMAVEGGFASATATLKQWCLSRCVGLVVVLEGGYNPETVSQGVLSVGCALTFPYTDATVTQCRAPQVPRVWADLRQKQERRQREWKLMRQEEGVSAGEESPVCVEPNDDALMKKHRQWCTAVVKEACAIHQKMLAKSS